MKRPASQFYWADWLRAPEVRASSLAARGLWMDMMALMHEGEPYGHLTVGGEPVDPGKLARMVGESQGKVKTLLAELEKNAVFSRTPEGAIYSRRMVRDELIRTVRAESGKRGGNPNLIDPPKDNSQDNQPLNQTFNQILTPSSSSSTSSASSSSETISNTNSAREELREKLPDDYRPDLDAFLRGVNTFDRQLSWIKSMDAHLTGLHAPMVTPELMGSCIRQFVGNGATPNWRLFLKYLVSETAPRDSTQPRAPSWRTDDGKGRGLLIIGQLRASRVCHVSGRGVGYSIDPQAVEALDPAAQQALKAIGGAQKVANHDEDKFGILASQFAAMYAAAASSKQSTESAA